MTHVASAFIWLVIGCAAGMVSAFVVPLAGLLPPLIVGMVVFNAYLRTHAVGATVLRRQLIGFVAAMAGLIGALMLRGVSTTDMIMPVAALLFGFVVAWMTEKLYRQRSHE